MRRRECASRLDITDADGTKLALSSIGLDAVVANAGSDCRAARVLPDQGSSDSLDVNVVGGSRRPATLPLFGARVAASC
jgi:hypothetical protein